MPISKMTAVNITAWRNQRLKRVQSGTVLRAWSPLHLYSKSRDLNGVAGGQSRTHCTPAQATDLAR